MHDSLSSQLSELAGYASGNARLDPPAALRQQGTRRGWRRRGGAALLGVGAVAAAGAIVGVAHPGVTGPGAAGAPATRPPASSASPAQLTSYQTAVLAKAHVTKAEVTALAKSGFTTAQISALAVATGRLTPQEKNALTIARIASAYLARMSPAERLALSREFHKGLLAQQIAALAKARLTAAQLAALAAG
jgi:hypothetical protein